MADSMTLSPACPHVTEAQVAANRVAAAARMGTHVGECLCCGGPSPKRSIKVPEGNPLDWVTYPYCGACKLDGETYDQQCARADGVLSGEGID